MNSDPSLENLKKVSKLRVGDLVEYQTPYAGVRNNYGVAIVMSEPKRWHNGNGCSVAVALSRGERYVLVNSEILWIFSL